MNTKEQIAKELTKTIGDNFAPELWDHDLLKVEKEILSALTRLETEHQEHFRSNELKWMRIMDAEKKKLAIAVEALEEIEKMVERHYIGEAEYTSYNQGSIVAKEAIAKIKGEV